MKRNYFGAFLLTLSFMALPSVIKADDIILEQGGQGPYKAVVKEEASLPVHTIFVPQDLSKFNAKNPLPVLVWGNGGCANSPRGHENFLNEIASYGYIVLATGVMPQNGGAQGQSTTEQQVESLDWVFAQNADKNSPYYQKLDTKNICISGMSCGGLQALYNCFDKRVSTIMICNSGLFNGGGNAAPTAPGQGMPRMGQGMGNGQAQRQGNGQAQRQGDGQRPQRQGDGQRPQRQGMGDGQRPQRQGDGQRPQRQGMGNGQAQGQGMGNGQAQGQGMPRMGQAPRQNGGAPAMGGMPSIPKSKLKDITAPIIYILGGETDIAYANGMDDFKNIDQVPCIATNLPVGHGGTYAQPHGGEFAIIARAWLDWQLKGDKEASKMFVGDDCGILKREGWTIEKNAKVK